MASTFPVTSFGVRFLPCSRSLKRFPSLCAGIASKLLSTSVTGLVELDAAGSAAVETDQNGAPSLRVSERFSPSSAPAGETEGVADVFDSLLSSTFFRQAQWFLVYVQGVAVSRSYCRVDTASISARQERHRGLDRRNA